MEAAEVELASLRALHAARQASGEREVHLGRVESLVRQDSQKANMSELELLWVQIANLRNELGLG